MILVDDIQFIEARYTQEEFSIQCPARGRASGGDHGVLPGQIPRLQRLISVSRWD